MKWPSIRGYWEGKPGGTAAGRARLIIGAAFMAASAAAGFIFFHLLLLAPPLPTFLIVGERPVWLLATAAMFGGFLAIAAGDWFRRALASYGLAVSSKSAWRFRIGHRELGAYSLEYEPAPVESGQRRVILFQLSLLYLSAALVWVAAGVAWRDRVAAASARRASDGKPVSLAELHRDVSPDADAYRPIREILDKKKFDFASADHPGMTLRRWDHGVAKVERPFLAAHEGLLTRELRPILRSRRRYVPADYRKAAADPQESNFGKFSGVNQSANLMLASAGLLSYMGDETGAWDAVADLSALAALQGQGAELLSKAIATVVAGRTARASLTVMLNRRGAVIPAALASELTAVGSQSYLREGLESMLAQTLDVYRAPSAVRRRVYAGYGMEHRYAVLIDLILRALHLDSAFVIEAMRVTGREAEPRPWHALRATLLSGEKARRASSFWALGWTVFTGIPNSTAMLYTRSYESAAWTRLALAFSALNAYRTAHGRYPDNLEQLSPMHLPMDALWDPFGNRPFGYAALDAGKGFELSSVGPFKTRSDSTGIPMVLRERF